MMDMADRTSLRRFLAGRAGAGAIVAILHVAGMAALLHAHAGTEPARVSPHAPLYVDFIDPGPVRETPPRMQAGLVPVAVQVAAPVVDIPVERLRDARTITAVPVRAPAAVAAVPASQESAADRAAPLVLSASEVEYLRRPAPHYPRAARQAYLQGTVLLWVLIGEDGHPQQVRVHRSSGHALLDREGRDAVQAALFKPYLRQGLPRRAQVIVPVEFLLNIQARR